MQDEHISAVTTMHMPGEEAGGTEGGRQTEQPKMIECENLVKIYKTKDLEVVALQGLDLVVEKGELMAIIGTAAAKSTLLNMLGGWTGRLQASCSLTGRSAGNSMTSSLSGIKGNGRFRLAEQR